MADYFMKIDGILGESTDSKHLNEIQVQSWSWGETNSSTFNTTGKSDLQELQFTARTSIASPTLFLKSVTSTHLKSAELVGRKTGGTAIEFLKVTLTDVLITSYQVAGSAADNAPLDQVSLDYARVQITYWPQTAGGAQGTPVTAGWDRTVAKNF